jgi:ATP-dependent Clp protease ATP-binding subunit ClpA
VARYDFFSYTSKDDEYNDYELMRKKRSCFRDLRNRFNLLARQGQLEECFGREAELLALMEILVRRQKTIWF